MTVKLTSGKAAAVADILEDAGKPADIAEKAAAELRRLYLVEQALDRCRVVCDATSEGWRADAERWRAQQEPVAWRWRMRNPTDAPGFVQPWTVTTYYPREQANEIEPLYTAPPQRLPLTEEEIQELSQQHKFDSRMEKFVRIIERAHGIGGQP